MDAKLLGSAVCLTVCIFSQSGLGATFKTANFVVTAPDGETAQKVAKCAEVWREDLALLWLGKELPIWFKPCPIEVKVGQIGAGGSTTFTFDNGEVFGWKMKVQGSLERILDSVIPHEVNHTIFASHFRRPLPRWADEGAATLFEHSSEQARQIDTLNRVMKTQRRIPLQRLLTIREYPSDMQDVLTLYAEGFSLASFLVGQKGEKGRKVYLKFLEDANRMNWTKAIHKHYGFENIQSLEKDWTSWVIAGSPSLKLGDGVQLAANARSQNAETVVAAIVPPSSDRVIRAQSPDETIEVLAMIPRQLRVQANNIPSETASNVQNISRPTSKRADSKYIRHSATQSRARGDAGDSRLRSGSKQKTTPPLPRESLSPTADGIFSNPQAQSYQFPEMRAF
jgi:hypothetical protein